MKYIGFILFLLMPIKLAAWEDKAILSFISQVNPLIQVQKDVSKTFTKPNALTYKNQLMIWTPPSSTVSYVLG